MCPRVRLYGHTTSLFLSLFHFPLTSLPPFHPPSHPLSISPLSGSFLITCLFQIQKQSHVKLFCNSIFLGGKTGLCKVLNKFVVTTDLFQPILVELYFNKISFTGKLLISSPFSNLVAWVCKSSSCGFCLQRFPLLQFSLCNCVFNFMKLGQKQTNFTAFFMDLRRASIRALKTHTSFYNI